MKTAVQFICSLLISGFLQAQSISKKLEREVKNLEEDSQMKSAVIGFYVTDKNGTVVFGRNATMGLAVASTQKVITSAASLELLGKDYRYKTEFAYAGQIKNGALNGHVYIVGYGDPTLGSWRYDNTKEEVILNKWIQSLRQAGITQLNGSVVAYDRNWESQTVPGGWTWDDIGNYYGAGASALNWRENQYDLKLKSGNSEGDKVTIDSIIPRLYEVNLINELTAGRPGSGDNAYIYLPPYAATGFIRGTIPPGQKSFIVSGSNPNPALQLTFILAEEFRKQGIRINSAVADEIKPSLPNLSHLHTSFSPPLDSLNYWFLKRSINLYGEALVKTLGYEKRKQGSTKAGLSVIKSFWKSNGIDSTSINMMDGSGLSPGNRITPEALVKVMQYAHLRPWFSSFYNALPEINGIKMKSGLIGGVRSFTGYIGDFTFAIVINNYNGSPGEIAKKMYRLLDILKPQ